MNRTLLLLAFAVSSVNLFAQELAPSFGPVMPVTPTNSTGSTRPRIALVQDSIPLVMWTKTGSGNGIVYVSRWNGTGFDPAMQISPSGLNVYTSTGEGGDIAARGDTVFIVFFTTDSRSYSVRSVDGGVTWGDTVRIDHRTGGDMAYTPDVQILPGGNPVVVFESANSSMTNTREMVCRSNDGGMTFSMETDAHLGIVGQPCECCPPSVLINDSMVYVLYRNNDNNLRNIVMTISSDSGNTFPVTSEFDQTNWNISSCPTSGPEAMFYADSILTVWKSSFKVYYGTGHATNGGEGMHYLIEPSLTSGVIQRSPSVCGSGDTIVFTWDDRRTSNYDVYIAISGSGPQQFSTVFMFNDSTGTTENGIQQTPHAAYHNGTIHLVYQDATSGKVMYRSATIAGVVGVPETSDENLIATYPTVVTEALTVNLLPGQSNVTARIFSVTGELISTTTLLNQQNEINCANLAEGTYILQLTDNDGWKFAAHFIKQ